MSEGQTTIENQRQGWFARRGALAFFIAALLCGTVARLRTGLEMPLWIDESFTATIATQPDFAGKAAGADPKGAILWFSDNPLTAKNRPQIGSMDPSWECRDFSRALQNVESTVSVYACRRPGN